MKTIPQEVITVLDRSTTKDEAFYLPAGNLDRKLYTAVNKVLEAAGGKWNKSAKAHIFPGNAADAIEPLILTGEYATPKQDFQQFDTPREIAQMVFDAAEIRDGMLILEPSAGIGRLLVPLAESNLSVEIECIEIDESRVFEIHDISRNIKGRSSVSRIDFLRHSPRQIFDRVIMNPPFTKGQDIAHVRHAYNFLKPGGRLVAIMSPGWTFRQDKRFAEFREWLIGLLGRKSLFTQLPDQAFKESGTNVNTIMVVIDKPE